MLCEWKYNRVWSESCQSQCSCRSWASRNSEVMPNGLSPLMGPGIVMSSHSMLSRPVSWRLKDRDEEEVAGRLVKPSSEVSIGKFGCSSIWFWNSCSRPNDLCSGSVSPTSVPSSRASNWLSESREARLGMGSTMSAGGSAICTWAGGRDRTVLIGRAVMLAITGIILGTDGSCWLKGVISAEYKRGWHKKCKSFNFCLKKKKSNYQVWK